MNRHRDYLAHRGRTATTSQVSAQRELASPRRLLLSMTLLLPFLAGPTFAYHPNHPLGFAVDRSYQGLDQLDQVDLFSGSLSLVMPIGPFALNYSSNVWRYQQVVENGQIRNEAIPDRLRVGGLGWNLSLGEVLSPVHALNDTGRWMFVDEAGTRRVFYDQLHRGEDDGDSKVLYTRDGSYLRLRKHNAFFVDIEFPSGMTRRYNSYTGGLGAKYRLEKSWSPFASESDPDMTVAYNTHYTRWTITDRYGRVHTIYTTFSHPFLQVVTKVEVGMVGGAKAPYNFEYTPTNIAVSCKDDVVGNPSQITVPLLSAVQYPDGSRYEMPSYHTTCANGIDDVTGALRELSLPTGGSVRWEYQEYIFPPGTTNSVFNSSAGVSTRQTVRKNGSVEGTWSYRSTSVPAGPSTNPEDDPKVITEVAYPTGDCSKHFFNARYYQNPSLGRGWEYGLPFDYSQSQGGRYLSAEVWTSSTGSGACSGSKLRSSYLSYRRDQTPGSGSDPASDWYNTNRQVSGTRTVFHDDGNRWQDVQHEDFDGLGHFRQQKTTGNLWSGSSNQELRILTTNFNRVSGTYGTAGYAPPSPSDPWVLGIHDFLRTEESDAHGQTIKQVDLGHEPDTGFLYCTRVRKNGTWRLSRDIITTYDRDSRGQITDVKTYGGDIQGLPNGGNGCGALPAQPEYWLKHGYTSGARTSTRPMQPDGTPGSYLTMDLTVDPTTGVTLVSREPNGVSSTFGYDLMGRVISSTPSAGARSTTQHLLATATQPVKIISQNLDPISGASLQRSELWLDDFGRTWRQRQRMPGNQWRERETLYNSRGWAASVSQWANLTKKVQFVNYDPFGRATLVRPPSGSQHDKLTTYQGLRKVTDQFKVAQVSGESYVSRVREYDSHGRLRKMEEPSGSGGSLVPTTYSYDVAGRLTRIRSGISSVQERLYTYDNRGFLLTETHPEKGSSGNGTVSYGNRDTRGLLRRLTDGPSDLSFGYDFMGRRTHVWDRNNGSRVVVSMSYDGALGDGLGKLWKATRNQWVDVPWVAGSAESKATVTETFDYQGLAGATSRKRTQISVGGEVLNLSQSYIWNDLGRVATQSWGGQSVSYVYDQGQLTDVVGWGSLAYHPSGPWSEITHANQVKDLQTLDPDFTERTGSLSTTGPNLGTVGTGPMTYDGAGNVKGIGVWSFAYDKVSRLVSSDFLNYDQSFSYDTFGNLQSKTTTAPGGSPATLNIPISSSTNRLTGGGHTYDAAGNLTHWGTNIYRWNESGMMESALAGQHNWIYLYNAGGERVANLMPSASQPVVRWTERDLNNRPINELFQVGSIGAPGTTIETKRYIYANGRLLASDGPDGVRHYHTDHLGSLRLSTDSAGVSDFGMSYLPYGEPAGTQDTSELLQFTGHERDHPTGLDYMHARFYTQVHGRFLSVDALRGTPGRPQSLNRYSYVEGNPMGLIDPDGRESAAIRQNVLDRQLLHGHMSPEEYAAMRREEAVFGLVVMGVGGAALGCAYNPVLCATVARYIVVNGAVGAGEAVFLNGLLDLGRTGSISPSDMVGPAVKGSIVGQTIGIPRVGHFLFHALEFYLAGQRVRTLEDQANGAESGSDGEESDAAAGEGCDDGSCNSIPTARHPDAHVNQEVAFLSDRTSTSTTTTVAVGSTVMCNQQSCFQVTISGSTREEISNEARRIANEISAVGGVNELILGACTINPYACAAGMGGGGGGIAEWSVIYHY